MVKRKINVGLLGLGRLGRIYARRLADAVANVRLVAVADPVSDLAKQVADEVNALRCYSDPAALLEDQEIEAVVITSPTHTHKEMVEAAAARGKAIFCEKPLSLSMDQAWAIKKAVNRAGVFFQMGLMRRFDRGYAAAKKKIDSGEIGKPLLFKGTSRDPHLPSLQYLDVKSSGGIFIDMGIHDFDLALWLVGKVQTVYSLGGVLAFPEVKALGDLDNAVVSLTFADGQLGVVDLSRSAVYGYDVATEILGSLGTLRIGYLRETPLLVLTKNNAAHDIVPYFPERFGEAYTLQLQNFVQNLLTGAAPPVTIDDGIEALRVSIAATQSYQDGKAVDVATVGNAG